MNILNINLNFFLNFLYFPYKQKMKVSLSSGPIKTCLKKKVKSYLESVLFLKESRPGKIVERPEQIFYEWRNLINENKLQVPFRLVNVDPNANLGHTWKEKTCFRYFFNEFLRLDPSERVNPKCGEDGLDSESYVLFAMGNEWIREMDLVLPGDGLIRDIPDCILCDSSYEKVLDDIDEYRSGSSYYISLGRSSNVFKVTDRPNFKVVNRSQLIKPRIKLNLVSRWQIDDRYKSISWDYIFFSISPDSHSNESDILIPLISQFIKQ